MVAVMVMVLVLVRARVVVMVVVMVIVIVVVRVRVGLELGEKIVNDPGIELGLTVCVTSRRYRQTNSAQVLKETNRLGLGLDLHFAVRVRAQVGVGDMVGVRHREG